MEPSVIKQKVKKQEVIKIDLKGMCKHLDATELLTMYEELIIENSRSRKIFKRRDELDAVYNEVFKRVFEYDR